MKDDSKKSIEERIDALEKESKLTKARFKLITNIIAIICICLAFSLVITNLNVITIILSGVVLLLSLIIFSL
ncbi:MAG: hypothetical protein IJI43_00225 [Bacilli bacterium]|nr:hypothetical protein [Bacilli bacterium]